MTKMGYNSVLILNDAVGGLDTDSGFAMRLADAIRRLHSERRPIDVRVSNHVNGCSVIETHHADEMKPILVGGNTSYVIDGVYVGWHVEKMELDLLQQLAKKHGYVLHRAGKVKNR